MELRILYNVGVIFIHATVPEKWQQTIITYQYRLAWFVKIVVWTFPTVCIYI